MQHTSLLEVKLIILWHQHYSFVLNTPPRVKQREVRIARRGRWLANIRGREEPVVINLPQLVFTFPQHPIIPFIKTRTNSNPGYTFPFKSLLLSAREMDRRLAQVGINLKSYERFLDIVLYVFKKSFNDFSEDNNFTLDELDHIVGLLNVGKSTFIDVVTFNLASTRGTFKWLQNPNLRCGEFPDTLRRHIQRQDYQKRLHIVRCLTKGGTLETPPWNPVGSNPGSRHYGLYAWKNVCDDSEQVIYLGLRELLDSEQGVLKVNQSRLDSGKRPAGNPPLLEYDVVHSNFDTLTLIRFLERQDIRRG